MAFPQAEATNTSSDSGTSHTVSLPAGIQAGETLLVFFCCDSSESVGWSAGWNEIFEVANGTQVTLAVAWRKATGGEGASITVTTPGSEQSAHISYRISGAIDPTSTAPEVSTGATGNDVNPNPDSLTAGGGSKEYLWIAVAGSNSGASTFSGYPYADNQVTSQAIGSGGCNVGVCSDEVETDTQDPGTFTIDQSIAWVACTVAVYPVVGATPQAVGSGAIAIAGSLTSTLTIFKAVGAGAISIAGSLGRLIKLTVGEGAITSAGSLGRKIYFYVGSGSITITGALGRLIKLAVGAGSIGIAGILAHFFFVDWQRRAVIHSGSIPSPIMLVEAVTKGDALGYDNGWKKAWAKSGSVVQFRCVAAEDGRKNQTITAYFGTVLISKRLAGGRAGRALYVEEGTGKGRYTQTKPTTVGAADTIVGYMVTGALALIHSSLNDDSIVT